MKVTVDIETDDAMILKREKYNYGASIKRQVEMAVAVYCRDKSPFRTYTNIIADAKEEDGRAVKDFNERRIASMGDDDDDGEMYKGTPFE